MPFDFSFPSIEKSPLEHDETAVLKGSTKTDCDELRKALKKYEAPTKSPILDIACGTGRHVRELSKEGFVVFGIDIDERMILKSKELDKKNQDNYKTTSTDTYKPKKKFAAITLFNRSIVCFHSHEQAYSLWKFVAENLDDGGIFFLDNAATPLWAEIKDGMLADGVSEDGQEQIIFLEGENRFCWRRGDAVDTSSWEITEKDRLFRAWSLNEIALAASCVGLISKVVNAKKAYIVFQKERDLNA